MNTENIEAVHDDPLDNIDSLNSEEFLYLLDSYYKRKSELEDARITLLNKIPQCQDIDYLLWIIYWKHGSAFNCKEISVTLGTSVRELKRSIPEARFSSRCQGCRVLFEFSVESKSQLQEIKKALSGKHKYKQHLCEECKSKKENARKEEHLRSEEYYKIERARREELSVMPYREYLESPEWKQIRLYKLRRAGYKCELCNTSSTLHVHHKTYENRGNERMSDLIVLCETCHAKFHDKLPKEKQA